MEGTAVSSSSEEWSKQAQQYFSKGLFGEAAFCFKKAGEDWWASVALAYGDRQVASRLPERHTRRTPAFTEVARNFDRLAQLAGNADNAKNAQLLFLNAAECFAIIPDHAAAAEAFYKGHKFTEAAYHYRRAGMFDEAVDVINAHKVDAEVASSIKYAAKFIYTRRRDVQSLQYAFNDLIFTLLTANIIPPFIVKPGRYVKEKRILSTSCKTTDLRSSESYSSIALRSMRILVTFYGKTAITWQPSPASTVQRRVHRKSKPWSASWTD